MKKSYFFIQITILFLVISNLKVTAQPYYFYGELESSNYNNIYRVNLSNGEKDLFLESVLNPLNFTWDNYQKWFYLFNRFGISIYQPENPTVIETIILDSIYDKGISSIVVPTYNYLFLSTQKNSTDFIMYLWEFNTSILNSQTLSEIKKISTSINPSAFLSNDENYIYQTEMDSINEKYINRYAIEMDSIIDVKYLSEIKTNESLLFEYGTKGKILFGFEEEIGNQETIKYFVYEIDSNNYYPEISFPHRSYGYLSPNAEYIILQQALWDTTKPSRENFNGEISVYKASTGELVKNFSLPPDGKILMFDSYPNDVFYLVNYETQPEVYNLTEVVLTSLIPSIALRSISFGSPTSGVTVRATGEFFTDSSFAYFNGNPKSTTIVSDTVLTFTLTGAEVSTLGNYPVWISNYESDSDTLYFSVVNTLPEPITPVLECVEDNGDETYTAYFGYDNGNSTGVYIPIANRNNFSPMPIDRGQPVVFEPGEQANVFSVIFDGRDLTWTLDESVVTANRESEPCP
jgi:hypothetical protein